MHELGIMYHIVRQVEDVMRRERLTEVEAVVLSVGASSPAIPKYLTACFPAAADGTPLSSARLEIERTEGRGLMIKEIRAR